MRQLMLYITIDLGKDDTCALEHRAEIAIVCFMEQRQAGLVAGSEADWEASMRPILLFLAIAGTATGAMAQPGPTTLTMTCAQARRIVASQGAVVLRTGSTTYDRYVQGSSFCALGETVHPAWIRTADAAQCPVGGVCRSVDLENGR